MSKSHETMARAADGLPTAGLDVSTHQKFYDAYSQRSTSEEYIGRAVRLRDVLLSVWHRHGDDRTLTVGDVGCGPGTITMAWAEAGHRAHGLDINEKLVDFARKTSAERGLSTQFDLGSATALPWPDQKFDICIVPELLEHVRDWQAVLKEAARVVAEPGLLFLSTTNRKCPLQNEFNLPGFSWYPKFLKQHYIKLAETTRPGLANFAKYPAYNWFTTAELRDHLRGLGFTAFYDGFDLAKLRGHRGLKGAVLSVITGVGMARWFSHFLTRGSVVVAVRPAPNHPVGR